MNTRKAAPAVLPVATERLLIREFVASDFEAVRVYAEDPQVVRFLNWGPNDLEQTKAALDRFLKSQTVSPRRTYDLAVVRKSDSLVIGAGALRVLDWDELEAQIGYAFRRDCWGQGYAAETAKALVKLTIQTMGFHRVSAFCDPQNFASARVLRKAGLRFEGRLREHKWFKDAWRDQDLYAALDTDLKLS